MAGPDLIDAAFKVFLCAAMGVGVWVLKGYIEQTSKTPAAGSGFLSLDSLQVHCQRIQSSCLDRIDGKISALAESVNSRLSAGDQLLNDHETRLRDIQIDLAKQLEKMKNIQENHAALIATEVINELQRRKRGK